MSLFDKDYKEGTLETCAPPCLSLYMPTHRHHPNNQQDPIRFENLVKALEISLQQKLSKAEAQPFLDPFLALRNDRNFWNHSLDGLAVLSAKNMFSVYKLQRPVAELAVVANSFHLKPLMRILQSADRYYLLGLNRKEIKLFEGNRDALDEVDLAVGVPRTITAALGVELTEPHHTVASYGGVGGSHLPMHHGHGGKKPEIDKDAERFFRIIDRKILEHYSQPAGIPLILAALPMHHHMFHEISHNPFLIPESLDTHPDALSSKNELRERAWKIMEPFYLARLATLLETFGQAKSHGLGDDDLAQVAKAIVAGRTATLLIEAGREIPGRIDTATGAIQLDSLVHPEIDDLLDDLSALGVKKGSKVVVIPANRMPTKTGIAAIYRH